LFMSGYWNTACADPFVSFKNSPEGKFSSSNWPSPLQVKAL
jgi:hypothetical protein